MREVVTFDSGGMSSSEGVIGLIPHQEGTSEDDQEIRLGRSLLRRGESNVTMRLHEPFRRCSAGR